MTEEEKKRHRCCFSGHRPEKLKESPEEVKTWLRQQITSAIAAGYTTFISGCAMGVDIWAGQIVLDIMADQIIEKGSTNLHLIAATPWPGFASRWSAEWQEQYNDLLKRADLVIPISNHYHDGVFQQRNEWMVDHSSRMIAFFNGAPGSTKNTIEYAEKQGIEVITNNPYYDVRPKEKKRKPMVAETVPYPQNLITDVGLQYVFGEETYTELSSEQNEGLEHALSTLLEREQDMLRLRYQEHKTLQEIGDQYGLSRERIRQIVAKGVRKLRHPSRLSYIRDGYRDTELALKIKCAEEIRKQLNIQKKRYPQMNEEDIVKFVFQGMLGVGHIVSSLSDAIDRLKAEMDGVESDDSEPLTEKISTDWVRLNLRSAKANGMTAEEIAWYLLRSAEWGTLSFTRQNVYNFCVMAYPTEQMKMAAEKILDEKWLPSHSEEYRTAYHPTYRELYRDFRKFKRDEA